MGWIRTDIVCHGDGITPVAVAFHETICVDFPSLS